MRPRPSRRDLLLAATAAATLSVAGGGCGTTLTDASPPTRLLPAPSAAAAVPPAGGLEDGREGGATGGSATAGGGSEPAVPELFAPRNWAVATIPPAAGGSGLVVRFDDARTVGGTARLRVTCAADVRGTRRVRVALAGSGRPLGEVEVRNPYPMLPIELRLSAADGEAARREGVRLTADAGALPVFVGSPDRAGAADRTSSPDPARRAAAGYLPQLLVGAGADPVDQLRDRLASLDSLQPWGWMAGCVLDGQQDLAAATGDGRFAAAAGLHLDALGLDALLSAAGGRGAFRTVADTLPVAAVARRDPGHPLVEAAIRFWESRRDADGCVRDPAGTTALAAYTVAYPMAVVAAARRVPPLAEQAARQLTLRLRRLVRDDGRVSAFVAAGTRPMTGTRPPTGARPPAGTRPATGPAAGGVDLGDPAGGLAAAWWMLGLARTLREMPPPPRPAELTAELARVAAAVRQQQPAAGVWPAVVGDPASGPESAATAGMAAAMGLAARAGLLPPTAAAAARRALAGLRGLMTPDGYVAGAAPREVGDGDGVARPAGDRVIAPYATGLAGQLLASLQAGQERA
jgi:unsaturated rhamnogalacturonyl hydrolase